MNDDVLEISLPADMPRAELDQLAAELAAEFEGFPQVEGTSTERTRSLTAASVLVLVKLIAEGAGAATALTTVVGKVVEIVRGRGLKGVTITRPDGTTIAIDQMEAKDLERLMKAAGATPPQP